MLLFKGYAAGPVWNESGDGSNFLCLPEEPQYKTYFDGTHEHRSTGFIQGVEYGLYYHRHWINSPFHTDNTNGVDLLKLHVRSATWKTGPRWPWFQRWQSAQPVGLQSTADTSCLKRTDPHMERENDRPTCAGMSLRRLQPTADHTMTSRSSTPLKFSVERCLAPSTLVEESCPAWSAPNDRSKCHNVVLYSVWYGIRGSFVDRHT